MSLRLVGSNPNNLDDDLNEFDIHLSGQVPWCFEKYHLLSLLCIVLESNNTSEADKTKVIQLLIKHSDVFQSMLRYGSKEISQILYEAEAKVRNIG
jgi:hypothetical protein